MWLPRLGLAAQEIMHGRIPFWNEFQFCGTPLLADASTNILNPYTIFYLFLSPEWAYTFTICGIFLLLVIGAWKYFRILNFSFTASMVATIGYVFGGQIVFWSLYQGLNFSMALFPWILFAFHKFEQEKKISWLICAFIFAFLNALGGFIQLALFTVVAVLIEGIKKFSVSAFKEALKQRLLTIILATLSASIITIPILEFCIFSHRKFVPYYEGLFPQPFSLLLMSLFGDSGNTHDYPNYYFYIGIILFTLGIFGIRKNFKKIISYPYIICSFIFPFTLIALYFNLLPRNFQFGMQSDPWRGMFFFIFALSLLAARGTDSFLTKVKENNMVVFPPLEFVTGTLICFYLALRVDACSAFFLKNTSLILGIILTAGFMLPFILKNTMANVGLKTKIFSYWIICLLIINGFPAAKYYLSTNVIHDYKKLKINQWKDKNVPLNILSGEGRVINLSPNTVFDGLFEHWAPYYRIRSIGNYTALIPRSIFLRVQNDGFLPEKFHVAWHFRNNRIRDLEILAKYGVLYLVDEEKTKDLDRNGWKLTGTYNDISLYRNPKYVGRAYIVDSAGKIIKGAKIIENINSYLRISVDADAGDTLVLADSWFPGWKCYDNAKAVKGFDANGFRGYTITTSGYHIIEWVYKPESFRLGAIISIISFSLFFLLVFWKAKHREK
ncbi:MAG: hypothetical protein WC330_02220 [Candidatus Omnitrophota bacterium]